MPKDTRIQDLQFTVAMAVVLSIFFLLSGRIGFIVCATAVLAVSLIAPPVTARLRKIWMLVAEALMSVVVRYLLCLVFFWVVLPVGLFRRHLFSRDDLGATRWRDGTGTVFRRRGVRITAADLVHPY